MGLGSPGLEGEALLCEALRARGIAFWAEQRLRAEGYFKTPDVKLQARPAAEAGLVHAALPTAGHSRTPL